MPGKTFFAPPSSSILPRELITAGAGDEKATRKGGFFVACIGDREIKNGLSLCLISEVTKLSCGARAPVAIALRGVARCGFRSSWR